VSDLIHRPRYMSKVSPFIGKPIIKVLTGIRRSGKSSLLQILARELKTEGVDENHILMMNLESLQFDHISTYTDLHDYVTERLPRDGEQVYLFVDEIQNVSEWERAIASFLADGVADITISGSNARLLSSELATLLSGRYVEIPIHPLGFSEFITFRGIDPAGDIRSAFNEYLRYGGFPGLRYLDLEDEQAFPFLHSLYSTIVLKDVVERHSIREPAQLDSITRYLFDQCGNLTTAKRIADYLKSQRVSVSVGRIQDYLSYLEQAFLVQRCRRYDLKGRRHLEFHDKFYLADVGIRHGLIGYRGDDVSGLLENIVYLELKARGYSVSVGKTRDYEIDFVAERGDERRYIQVCYLLAGPDTVEREYRALESIPDNFPKLVLSMDEIPPGVRSGVEWQNLLGFLLEDE
jgi:predicted AAA+ superfamily ATPase